jgi:hypothetical protein
MDVLESGKLLGSMHSMSSNSAHSTFSIEALSAAVNRGRLPSQTLPTSSSPPRSGGLRSRSVSPEPRSSSTLVVVAGLLERDVKVAPRDFRRNRRKPVGGGHHAAMPSDSECHEPCTLTVKFEGCH